jgi:hypothetical protein
MEFEAYFGEDESIRECNVSLRIGGNFTDASLITRRLQIDPTRAYGKDEKYVSKTTGETFEHPIGHWSISSEALNSTSVERHCEFLLNIIEPVKEAIQEFINDPNVWVSIVFWWASTVGHGGYSISPDKAIRLASLCQDFRFHFL